jgi:glycosyltransferase involved in cell wall biosynthesis
MQYNNQPLVSIIMNCYNGETFLHESIKSVLSQTYENWELIFWDNKSEDKSAEIFKSYNDKRFKYYYADQHTLLYAARNEAIKKSSGEFVAFLDTDDFWEKDKLELQIPLFKDPRVGVVYGNLFVINEKMNTKKIYLKRKKLKGLILDELLKNYCTLLVTLVVRKSFLDNYQPPFDNLFHIAGDFDLMIRMSAKYRFDCVEKPIASYRVHEKNESLLNRGRQIKELKSWYKKMINYPIIFNNKNFSNINNLINNLEIANLILENDRGKAWVKIKKMPYSFKKIKYLMALFLPNNFVKRFI